MVVILLSAKEITGSASVCARWRLNPSTGFCHAPYARMRARLDLRSWVRKTFNRACVCDRPEQKTVVSWGRFCVEPTHLDLISPQSVIRRASVADLLPLLLFDLSCRCYSSTSANKSYLQTSLFGYYCFISILFDSILFPTVSGTHEAIMCSSSSPPNSTYKLKVGLTLLTFSWVEIFHIINKWFGFMTSQCMLLTMLDLT